MTLKLEIIMLYVTENEDADLAVVLQPKECGEHMILILCAWL